MKTLRGTWCLLPLLFAAMPASAAVVAVADDAFQIRLQRQSTATPAQLYAAVGAVARWWNPAHTWSGDAAHLSLPLQAGACFCERWTDGETEHLRVLMVRRDQRVRLSGALGPLQGMGLDGVLDLGFEAAGEDGTRMLLEYRVSGDSLHRLGEIAGAVDAVLADQFERLANFAEHGDPGPAPVTKSPGR